jgi:hypothetical protein
VYKTPAPSTTHTHRTTRTYITNTNYTTQTQLHIKHTPPEPHAKQRTAPATTPTTPVSTVHNSTNVTTPVPQRHTIKKSVQAMRAMN